MPCDRLLEVAPDIPESVVVDYLVVLRCLAGEETAWEEMHRRCYRALLATIRALMGSGDANEAEVDEIAAEVWLALLDPAKEVLTAYDPSRNCRLITYLARLARREILKRRRTDRRRRQREVRAHLPVPGPAPAEVESALQEFLLTLSAREREFCEEHLLAPPSAEESERWSDTNAWQLRHRVHRKLRNYATQAE